MSDGGRFGAEVAHDFDHGRALPAEAIDGLLRGIVAATGLRSGARVLDAGAGTGVLARAMVRDGYRYAGIDSSEAMLRRFQATPADLVQGDLRCLPLRDETIDLIVAFRVLGVVRGWRHGVRECLRVMRGGGHLVAGRVERDSGSLAAFIRSERNRLLGEAGFQTGRPGAEDAEIDAELARAMEQIDGIGPIEFRIETAPRRLLEQNLSGWRVAQLGNGSRADLHERLAAVVQQHAGDLDMPLVQAAALRLGVYRKRAS